MSMYIEVFIERNAKQRNIKSNRITNQPIRINSRVGGCCTTTARRSRCVVGHVSLELALYTEQTLDCNGMLQCPTTAILDLPHQHHHRHD